MKKLLLVLALVMAYGISVSNAKTVIVKKAKTETVVADDTSVNKVAPEEKDKKVKKDAKKTKKVIKKESHGCAGSTCGEAQKKSCAASKKSCCGSEKKAEGGK